MAAELVELGPAESGWEEVAAGSPPGDLALLAPDHPFLEFGTWRAFAVMRGGVVLARMIASVDTRQRSDLGAVGCIGFAAVGTDRAAAEDDLAAARWVLAAAIGWLERRECRVVRSPVQLSTWYGHRAMTGGLPEDGGPQAFPLEPRSGRALADVLRESGFGPAHRAVSCLVRSDAVITSAGPVLDRIRRAGWDDRALRLEAIEEELGVLHRLSSDIFRESWGFSEISLAEFAALYRPAALLADPDMVRIAMDGTGHPLGFAFALPADLGAGGGRGFVLKTLGLVPEARRRFPGSGPAMAALIHRTALERGLRDGIHALMAEGSPAHRISLRWGAPIRSYATFERALA